MSASSFSLEAQRTDPALARVVDGLVVQRVAAVASGFRVITEKDLAQIVDLQAQRTALGCDTATCLSELAGALGARYILCGSLGRLGDTFVVQLHLFDSRLGGAIARADARSAGEEALLDNVPIAVDRALAKLTGTPAPAPADASTAPVGASGARAVSEQPPEEASSVLSWSVLSAGTVITGGAAELALRDTSGTVGANKLAFLWAGRVGLGAVALAALLVVVGSGTMAASLLIE